MSRKGPVPKRKIIPDPRFGDAKVAKFVNMVMKGGKKSLAERIVYGAIDSASERVGKEGIALFHEALDNVMPVLEVRPRRVGGATYQVPVEVRPERRLSLGMRWLIGAARKRSGKPMMERLADEFVDAAQGVGTAVKERDNVHRMAEANKAFAHYRW